MLRCSKKVQESLRFLDFFYALLEPEQIQPDLLAEAPVHHAVDNGDDHLAHRADHGPIQVPAEYLPLFIACAHVQVGVEFTVHGVDGAGQGHDLKAAAEAVGVVLLLCYIIYAYRKAVGGAQRLHGGKARVLIPGVIDVAGQQQGLGALREAGADGLELFRVPAAEREAEALGRKPPGNGGADAAGGADAVGEAHFTEAADAFIRVDPDDGGAPFAGGGRKIVGDIDDIDTGDFHYRLLEVWIDLILFNIS